MTPNLKKPTLQSVGGRKYFFLWIAFISGTVAMFIKRGTFVEWVGLVLGLGGLYFEANIRERKARLENSGQGGDR